MSDEFRVQQAIAGGGIFVLNCPWHVSRASAEAIKQRWQDAWREAGRSAPPLLILDGGASLQPLEEAEMRELGLMRMPAP